MAVMISYVHSQRASDDIYCKEKSKGASKATKKSVLQSFVSPFRLSLALSMCPWVPANDTKLLPYMCQ